MTDLRLRPAAQSDVLSLFEWRNDPLTRSMSVDIRELDFKTHDRWFSEALARENCYFLIAQTRLDSIPVGVVRFDIDMHINRATVSINLSPKFRGKGMAYKCLSQAIIMFKEQYSDCRLIFAQIKSNNLASIKSFERAGFALMHESKKQHREDFDNQESSSSGMLLNYELRLGS